MAPALSIGRPCSSTSRQPPITSKFSRANPSGSITAWQLAQVGLRRWRASRSRIVAGTSPGVVVSRSVSTPAGGAGTGAPKMLSASHFPRSTGEVRSGYDVVASSAPAASSPPRRAGSGNVTRRNRLP